MLESHRSNYLLRFCRRLPFLGMFAILIGVAACGAGSNDRDPARKAPAADGGVESWGPVEPALATKFQAALEAARAEQDLPGLAMAVA